MSRYPINNIMHRKWQVLMAQCFPMVVMELAGIAQGLEQLLSLVESYGIMEGIEPMNASMNMNMNMGMKDNAKFFI
jgi:hypothetical protein